MPYDPAKVDPARVAVLPGAGALMLLGMAFVLVPGIVLFVVLFALGANLALAGMLGLLMMFIGVGIYPFYLRRLGRRLPS